MPTDAPSPPPHRGPAVQGDGWLVAGYVLAGLGVFGLCARFRRPVQRTVTWTRWTALLA